MIEDYFVRTLEIQRATVGTDRYGNESPDWNNATTTITKGWVAQVENLEVLTNRDAESTRYVVRTYADTDLRATDRVRVDGEDVYEVDGPPYKAPTPRGAHHLKAFLTLVEG